MSFELNEWVRKRKVWMMKLMMIELLLVCFFGSMFRCFIFFFDETLLWHYGILFTILIFQVFLVVLLKRPFVVYMLLWIEAILLSPLNFEPLGHYGLLPICLRSPIFFQEKPKQMFFLFKILTVIVFLPISFHNEYFDYVPTIGESVFLVCLINVQVLVDISFYVFIQTQQFLFIDKVEKDTISRITSNRRFVLLWSHTTKNLFSGITPPLTQLNEKIKKLKKEQSEIQKYLDLSITFSRMTYRKIFNLHALEIIRSKRNSLDLNSKRTRYNFGVSVLEYLNLVITKQVEMVKQISFSVVKRSGEFPRFCDGDEVLVVRLLENMIWGMIRKSKPLSLRSAISFDEKRNMFIFELVSCNRNCNAPVGKKNPVLIDHKEDIDLHLCIQWIHELPIFCGGKFELWEGDVGMTGLMEIPLIASKDQGEIINSSEIASLKILVVEDNLICRRFIRKFIERSCVENSSIEHTIEECENGFIGYNRLEGGFNADLIITDYDMPIWNGEKFACETRKENLMRKKWCKIHLMTGATFSIEKKKKFEEEGIFDGITSKPIRFKAIQSMITDCMKQKRLVELENEGSEGESEEEEESFVDVSSTIEEKKEKKNSSSVREFFSSRKDDCKVIFYGAIIAYLLGMNVPFLVGLVAMRVFVIQPLLSKCIIKPFFLCNFIGNSFFGASLEDRHEMSKIVANLMGYSMYIFIFPPSRFVFSLVIIQSHSKLKKSNFKFSIFLFLCLSIIELVYYFFISDNLIPLVKFGFGISTLTEFSLLLRGEFSVRSITDKREYLEKKKKEGISKLIIEENNFKDLIFKTSETIQEPFALLGNYVKLLHEELIRSDLFSDDTETKRNISLLLRNMTIFHKDSKNLLLLGVFLKDDRVVSSRRVRLKNMIIPIRKVVNEIIQSVAEYFSDESLEFWISSNGHVESHVDTMIQVNPNLLQIILSNLVLNAIQNTVKDSHHNQKIKIDIHYSPFEITISDSSDEIIDKNIFTCFHQKKRNRKEFSTNKEELFRTIEVLEERSIKKGEETGNPRLGIGLLCCQKLITEHDSSVSLSFVDDVEGKGSKVVFQYDISSFKRKSLDYSSYQECIKNLNYFVFFEEDEFYANYIQEILIDLGCSNDRIDVVGKRLEDAEMMYFRKKKEYDICILRGGSDDEFNNYYYSERRKYGNFCCFVKNKGSFGNQGIIVGDEMSVVCGHPLRKFDLERVLEYFFYFSSM